MAKAEIFPVKYLEENLVFNARNGNVWAYYECIPKNYSCISEEKAESWFRKMRQVFPRCGTPRIHLLMLSLEEDISETFDRTRALVKGDLKEEAFSLLDGVEDYIKEGRQEKNICRPHFFLGFQLNGGVYEAEGNGESSWDLFVSSLKSFIHEVNESFGDYTRIPNKEVDRYLRMERLLRGRIGKLVRLRRADPRDMAYIIRHLDGQKLSWETYDFTPEVIIGQDDTRVKTYDLVRLSSAKIVNHERDLELVTEEGTRKAAYLALSEMRSGNEFPFSSEILYYMQEDLRFPVDVSIQVERLDNRASLQKIRGKREELKDLDESAFESGSEASQAVYDARGDVYDLEARLEKTREDLYKVSWLVRVEADSDAELTRRVTAVKDVYANMHMILERPLCDQAGLHEEFYPSGERYLDDYIQYVRDEFLAGVGFGVTQVLGDREGIYLGYALATDAPVFFRPDLAAKGEKGTTTNALASAYIGSLGGGKSVAANLVALWSVLFGSKVLVVDPKGERRNWERDLPFLSGYLNLVDVIPGEENRGMFDPFRIIQKPGDAYDLAVNILSMMTGVTLQDGERFPVLTEHIGKVRDYTDQPKGMLCIIRELEKTGTKVSLELAAHIRSFADLSIASLIFGDGTREGSLSLESPLNVILVQELMLPEPGKPVEQFTIREFLSVVVLMTVSYFAIEFIGQERSLYKQAVLDEAWSWLQVSEGKQIAQKMVRTGRSLNAGIAFVTQNCDDLLDERMKNNIGMKFAFRSTDPEEIRKTLSFLDLEYTEANIETLKHLENGQCLFRDIRGGAGVIQVEFVYEMFAKAFDTRPPEEEAESVSRRRPA